MKKTQMSRKLNKVVCISLIINMIIMLFLGYQKPVKISAATDAAFEKSIAAFPESYKVYLRKLHTKYPKWTFKPYNTGLNFSTVVSKEFSNNRSLIENSFSKFLKSNGNSSDFIASSGTYIAKDGGTWVSASKNCVAYFVDPRNFLNETHIYMFEQLSYDASAQTKAGVEAILQGSFMYKTKIGYITTKGKYKSTNIYYSDQILEAAKSSKVSAYYLASKIIQEIGTRANAKYAGMGASGSISGTYSKAYTGIYNFYNIGAFSSGSPIANGLSWASSGSGYSRPWNTPMKSINGGAEYIGEKYINCGQNTPYYQRFNVNKSSTYSLYTHQYMTNIYGAASEASITADAYEGLGIDSLAKTFVIPVYTNMPKEGNKITYGASSKKGTITSGVNLRKAANTSGKIVTTLNTGDIVTITKSVMTSSRFNSRWLSNPYWYKVKIKKNGKTYKGFLAATFVNINQEYSVVQGKSITPPTTMGIKETVYYRSDNPRIAKVNSSGKITGKASGTVTVYAFTPAGRFSATSVKVYTSGCTFSQTALTLNVGANKKMPATVYPSTAKEKTVKYVSSNKAVATITSTGNIKAKAPGVTTITATPTIGGASAKCMVRVILPVSSISLDKNSVKLKVGAGYKLQPSIKPGNASIRTLTWTTSNSSVATADSSGKVYAKASGTAKITAKTHNGLTASCDITVIPADVVLTGRSAGYNEIKLGWKTQANITGYYLYRKGTNGKYQLLNKLSGKTGTYTDKELVCGQNYSYRIIAYKTAGKKTYKSSQSNTVTTMPVPKKVKIKSIKSEKASATITWSVINGASGYEIYRSVNTKKHYKKIKTIKDNKTFAWTNKKLKKSNTYYYKIRAYTVVSGKKIYGDYSKQKKIKK